MQPVLVVAGRLALLLAAAAAVAFAFTASPSGARGVGAPTGAAAAAPPRFTCPMHPEVTEATAGAQCPICRMALEEVRAPADTLGQTVATVERRSLPAEIRAPAWAVARDRVAAVVYKDEVAALLDEPGGLFFAAAHPDVGIAVRATREPPVAWDASTEVVTLELKHAGRGLDAAKPEVGWIVLPARTRQATVVPASALLYAHDGPFVLVADQGGRGFSRREIEIGRVTAGMAAVTSGLSAGERIAVGGVFSQDAELRLTARAQAMGARP